MSQHISFKNNESSKWIVILHGYGANSNDLAPLARELDPNQSHNWLFLNAPYEIDIGMGFTGRAWFHLQAERLNQKLQAGEYFDMSDFQPQESLKSSSFILELLQEHKVDISQSLIGGFSQGSMMAIEFLIWEKLRPKGLMILSGNRINWNTWQSYFQAQSPFPTFISHGSHDPVLDPKSSEILQNFLKENGYNTYTSLFPGQHEIPFTVISSLKEFIQRES